ncbi:hypothetical protein [Ferruginibacter sp.]
MRFYTLLVLTLCLANFADGQSNINTNNRLLFVDSNFITQMCIGKSLSYYRKVFATNDHSILQLKVYDHKNVLIVGGYLIEGKKDKYLAHGQWRFYTASGKLRKTGSFDSGFKTDYWLDFNSDQEEFYKTHYRKEDKIGNEQIAILDAGVNLEIYFDIKQLLTGIKLPNQKDNGNNIKNHYR